MTAMSKAQALETWFRANSGSLCEGLRIAHNDDSGLHLRATAPIEPGITIASAPHSITLSYLNALVDDANPVFKQQRHRFKVEAIGFFYLMIQYVHRETSFWKAYLDALPAPENDFSQPLFFENAEDVAWIEGTNVWHTITARKEVYAKYYEDGIAVLAAAGLDVRPYTWHLFKWSTMIFASRSFTSLALLSMGSKYRTAYKSTPAGSRQAVLIDVSRMPAEDLDFPVLFPGLDAGNHDHTARVDWKFDPGRFSIQINDRVDAASEVFNNYGPKGNDELLIGYGFCIPNNPYDTVALTLKAPPLDLQNDLKDVQPGYFDSKGEWSSEKATFRLKLPPSLSAGNAADIFCELPEPLLELLLYTLRHERHLPFSFIPHPFEYMTELESPGSRHLPHIARIIVQFLSQTLSKLQSIPLPSTPQTTKQKHACTYRNGQLAILQNLISALRTYTRSLIWTPLTSDPGLPAGPALVRLEHLIPVLLSTGILDATFMPGIAASANSADLEDLRGAGWEEDIWVLLLCYLSLRTAGHTTSTWARYVNAEDAESLGGHVSESDEAEDAAQARALLDIVRTAAAALPGSCWEDDRWTPELIAAVGGRVLRYDGFTVMCPTGGGAGRGEEARFCLYLHPTGFPHEQMGLLQTRERETVRRGNEMRVFDTP